MKLTIYFYFGKTIMNKCEEIILHFYKDLILLMILLSEENDYSLAFYVFDGFVAIAIIISLFLKVNVGREADVKPTDEKAQYKYIRTVSSNCLL